MNQKKALGRGLSALIPQKGEPAEALAQIPLERIAANPYQPRKEFDEKSIDELARSVREHGIVQPLVVSRRGDQYRLIAGERRFRAAQKAGLLSVPAIIKDLHHDSDALQIALIENIQREDLNPMEEANAYHQLHDDFGLTQEEISRRVGKERSTVANFLRLLKLPEPVKKLGSPVPRLGEEAGAARRPGRQPEFERAPDRGARVGNGAEEETRKQAHVGQRVGSAHMTRNDQT
jgi:ParB family chromosome partitioning protein